jgi:hypothetical protein
MGLKELYLEKKAKIESEAMEAIAKIEEKKAADVLEIDSMVMSLEAELKAAEDKGFDLGVAQAGIPAGDKIYTEADLQAEKELAVKPFLEQVASLEAKVVELANKVLEVEASVQPKIDQAVASKQAEMVADFEATQVDDQAFLGKYKV